MMKRIAIYTILLAVLGSTACTRTDEYDTLGHQGSALVVNAELVSASDRATRGGLSSTSQGAECGQATLSTDGEFLITATREEWTGVADSLQRDGLTRGTPIISASGIANMRINIFNTKTADWSAAATLTESITATKSGGGYTTSPTYNWLFSDVIKTSFFAYSPAASGSNGLSDNGSKITYTVPTAVADQPDLCVAKPKLNIINADGLQQTQTFALSHQLTAVGFSMLGWNLKVDKITVSGINTTGTLTMNANGAHTWTSSNPGSRDVGVTKTSYTHSHNSPYADITTASGYLMMIPQALSDAATVTITYTSTGAGSTSGTLVAKLNELETTWGAGDKVTYNIRLKTAPAVTSGNLTINDHRAGYTTSSPLSIIIDPKDKLTFSWSASWLKMHRGSPKAGDASGGEASPWLPGLGGPWGNIYFFTTTDNTSTTDARMATVTVSGTRSGTKQFTVTQVKKPIIPIDYTATPANSYVAYPKDGKMQAVKFNALKKPVAKYQKGSPSIANATGSNPSTAAADAALANDITYLDGDVIEVSWQTAVDHANSGDMVIQSIVLGADGIATVYVNGAGNAVLSYKRESTILWNYHIWATDSDPFATPAGAGGNVNGTTPNGQARFMDRNLGALDVYTPSGTTKPAKAVAYKYFGVLYQHGRPTPFSGQGTGETINTYTDIYNGAATKLSSGTIGGFTQSNTAVSSVTDAIKTPNAYYRQGFSGYYWSWFSVDISLWSDYGTNKSIYDPCPYGYRVPNNESWSPWGALHYQNWTANAIGGGALWSSTWWPAAGYRVHNSGAINDVGNSGLYWSSTRRNSPYRSYDMSIGYNGGVIPSSDAYRSFGYSVRCVEEGY